MVDLAWIVVCLFTGFGSGAIASRLEKWLDGRDASVYVRILLRMALLVIATICLVIVNERV